MKKEQVKEVYKFLFENEYIAPGHSIDEDVLTMLFKIDDVESMEYIACLILLKTEIESHGHFCKMHVGSLNIYTEDEAHIVSKRRIQRAQRINQNTQRTLLNLNAENISSSEARSKYIHQLNLLNTLNRSSRLIFKETKIYQI